MRTTFAMPIAPKRSMTARLNLTVVSQKQPEKFSKLNVQIRISNVTYLSWQKCSLQVSKSSRKYLDVMFTKSPNNDFVLVNQKNELVIHLMIDLMLGLIGIRFSMPRC